MSVVYFIDARGGKKPLVERLPDLVERLLQGEELRGNVALKMHFGEKHNETFIKPFYIKAIVDSLKKRHENVKFFLTDTTTIYKGERYNAIDHIMCAVYHGFSPSYIGCPVIIADGLSDEGVSVSENVEIARAIYDSDALIVISHATGHGASSYGGALKNVAMGCVTKRTKKWQHEVTKPVLNDSLCNLCGECERVCGFNAIKVKEKVIFDAEKCIGCGSCIAVCGTGALRTEEKASEKIQKRIAFVAKEVLKHVNKAYFINFAVSVTPFCDCAEMAPRFICEDIGVLASADIVSIDNATIDLIGISAFEGDPKVQVREAQKLGLGEMSYELRKI